MSTQLGAEELAYLQAHGRPPSQGHGQAPGLASELVIRRRALELMLPVMLGMVAAVVAAMGQVLVGVGVALTVLVAVLIHGRRRVARLHIADDGTMSPPGRLEPLDWSTLRAASFQLCYPFGASRLGRAANETAVIHLTTGDGRGIKFARGPLWRLRPTREPVSWADLGRELERQARAAGMVLKHPIAQGWIATRRTAGH